MANSDGLAFEQLPFDKVGFKEEMDKLFIVARKAREAGLKKGSGEPNKLKVGKITEAQVRKIAEIKMKDLNATSVESAMSSIRGTARSMGVNVVA